MSIAKRSKIVCKGNVPAKMAANGVDTASLMQTTLDLSGASFVDTVREQAMAIADTIVSALQGAGYADVLERDDQNGAGFMQCYADQIVADVVATAVGTASQGRARKVQLVQSGVVPSADLWESDGKQAKAAPKGDDPFAALSV